MRRLGEPRAPEISTEAFQRLLDENRELRELTHRQQEEIERLRHRVEELETALKGDGRRPPPPAFVKPNVKKDPVERKRSGAKDGHEVHLRRSPTDSKELVQITEGLRAHSKLIPATLASITSHPVAALARLRRAWPSPNA